MSNQEGQQNIQHDQGYYDSLLKSYAEKVIAFGKIFADVNEDPESFQNYLVEHPTDNLLVRDYFIKDRVGLMQFCGDEVREIDELIMRLRAEIRPIVIKRIINKLMKIINPEGSSNACFEGSPFSAESL